MASYWLNQIVRTVMSDHLGNVVNGHVVNKKSIENPQKSEAETRSRNRSRNRRSRSSTQAAEGGGSQRYDGIPWPDI